MLFSSYPVSQGMQLRLRTISSLAADVRAFAEVEYDDGTKGFISLNVTVSASRVDEVFVTSQIFAKRGAIINASAELVSGTKFRGRVFARLDVTNDGPSLAEDYIYLGHEAVLGQFVSPGPGGGSGYRTAVVLKASGAPAPSTTVALDLANTFRRWHSFEWLYDASADAATRVLAVGIRTPIGTALPTGFTAGGNQDVYRAPGLTLTASEEGMIWFGPKFAMTNDNGTIVVQSTASAPSPLPLDVTEEFTIADIVFSITDSHANDRDVIYGEREEWLVPG